MKRMSIALACCLLVLAMGLTACGGSSSSSSSSSTSASTSSSSSSSDSSSGDPSGSASASASSSASSQSSSSGTEEAAKAEYDRAVALYDEGKFYSAKAAFENSGYGDWEQRAAECVQPMPETGELFHDPDMTSDNMILIFDVKESEDTSDNGMYIAVYTKDKKLVETVFINGVGTVETMIPGGEYYIKDASGPEWYGENEQFGPNGHYENMVFDEVEGDRFLKVLEEGYEWVLTMNATDDAAPVVGSEEDSWENRS